MWLIKRAALLGGLSGFALLAACTASRAPVEGAIIHAPTPLDQYAIGLSEAPDQVGLAVHAEGISSAQRAALAAFADRWRTAGSGPVTLQTPNDCADPEGAKSYAQATISTLAVLGVPYERVRIMGYAAGPGARPIVLASFTRAIAVAPDCRDMPWGDITATGGNRPMNRLGCTLVANMAAQIADPNDLRGDTRMAPADDTRRMVILGKYRDGKVTASDKDDQASGAISSAVKP